ncbi:SDR family NAD(P)-dependent oxidoreductase [Haloactinomyces albus]|uniref:NAD(P)-dependent dehydrogenase (Short-subunit alcohol dehydrogenase family) n=1 Tax=Haloactinomyces albus TaxID=1352928 RepID=A0AAE3ZGY7_9ACTN|nr:SDR family oxidoreductase [Haloactinomyces albus]MDR7303560.1 NAD(P)-dependent dehydrogenase (short-subunit alcohol dehydrogenase family) [Haloactinomyces albus]
MSTPGRVCLVTGASRGIGRAVAERLVAEGCRVALVARTQESVDEVKSAIGKQNPDGETMAIAADVTDTDEIERMFGEVETRWGPVEVVVSNAGSGAASPLVETTDEEWQHMMDLNLTAPFRCVRRALPTMLEAGWGRIVVIASVVAKRGEATVSAYTASKHGVLGLVRSAAAEVAGHGVTVNAVCPGYVDTPMTDRTVLAISRRSDRTVDEARQALVRRQPVGRLIDTAEVAEAVHFCVVNGAVTGQGINVDGGAVQS